MGAETKIQWTDHTFNPWIGCAKVSAGCTNCYAEVQTVARVKRGQGIELWGPKAARHRTGPDNWRQPEKWNREAERDGVRHRVFCASLCDVFEDRRDLDPLRTDLFALIERTPWLDWQLLTKRTDRMIELAPASWRNGWPRNAWAGTSVEDQRAADERISHLLRVPATVRFLSCEPLLSAVDLSRWLDAGAEIGWVIIGGESGSDARPCSVESIRSLVKQCRAVGSRPFVKQFGSHVTCNGITHPGGHWPAGTRRDPRMGHFRVMLRDPKGGDPAEWPEDLRIREMPRSPL